MLYAMHGGGGTAWWLVFLILVCWVGAADPPYTVYVLPTASGKGDGSSQRPFATLREAVTAGLREPPSTTTWTILMREGVYRGPGQVEVSIRDTKRFIIFFENRGVEVLCERAEYWIDFSGLGGRGSLEITGNGGTVQECQDSAVRSRRKTFVSGVMFLSNRALLRGSALRVHAGDTAVDVQVEGCTFRDQLQRPVESPSTANDQGGGAVWVSGVARLDMADCVFFDNEASQGGGLYVVDSAVVHLKRCRFQGNEALLPEPGGGGMVVLARQSQVVALFEDCVFVENGSGGQAAGIYLGGPIQVTMVRVEVHNSTSRYGVKQTAVGVMLWGQVQGRASNMSMVGNLNQAGQLANFGCGGYPLNNDCQFQWNGGCDLCRRKVVGLDLDVAAVPCAWPSLWVWQMQHLAIGLSLLCGVLLFGSIGGFLLWRKCRSRKKGKGWVRMGSEVEVAAVSSDLEDSEANVETSGGIPLEVMPMERNAVTTGPLGSFLRSPKDHRLNGSTSRPIIVANDDEEQDKQCDEDDFEDDGDEIESDYSSDERGKTGASVRWLPSTPGGTRVGSDQADFEPPGYGDHSSHELLPSRDFVRHSPAPSMGALKEIAYEELALDAEPIGSGAFGLVYRAVWRGSVVAVKKYIGTLSEQGVADFRAEAQLLHAVGNHPNVIKLFGACTVSPNFCLVLPYYPRGSVRSYFSQLSKQKLTWGFVKEIALQVIAGMIHLHCENIVHRDLAARNILVDGSDTIRITDFGLARFLMHNATGGQTTSNVGAVAWMSPEAVAERRYSKKSDVWSFGVTLWEMCTGQLPFQDMEPIHTAVAVSQGQTLEIPDYVPAGLAKVMKLCWAWVPSQRPTFEELYEILSRETV